MPVNAAVLGGRADWIGFRVWLLAEFEEVVLSRKALPSVGTEPKADRIGRQSGYWCCWEPDRKLWSQSAGREQSGFEQYTAPGSDKSAGKGQLS